jgi:hypothetical protein
MNNTLKKFLWVSAYAAAMALLEAVVVVYLRGLLQITNDHVTLGPYDKLEMGREIATLVMLAAVGWLAGRNRPERWAYGLFTFGLWDIWYYVWLKVLIDWPGSLLAWDTLFLLPLTWWGPVLAPTLIAGLLCLSAVLAVVRLEQGQRLGLSLARLGLMSLGVLLALYVFMATSLQALLQGQPDWAALRPEPFLWPLFLLALALLIVPALQATWPEMAATPQARREKRIEAYREGDRKAKLP